MNVGWCQISVEQLSWFVSLWAAKRKGHHILLNKFAAFVTLTSLESCMRGFSGFTCNKGNLLKFALSFSPYLCARVCVCVFSEQDNLGVFLRGCEEFGLKGSQLFDPGDLQDTSARPTAK